MAPAPAPAVAPQPPAQPRTPQALPAPQTWPSTEPVPVNGEGFEAWLARVEVEAQRRGVSARTAALVSGLTPIAQVIELDRRQTTATASFDSYRARTVNPTRIARGRGRLSEHQPTLAAIERQTGVPAAILVAIWGMETSYGANTGRTPVLRALATLGHDGRRAALFQRELISALQLIDSGAISADATGSWAGALGQPQFMPSTYLAYGVDQDANGRVDLWASLSDVFGSIGNFLKVHGWDQPASWGLPVQVPAGFDPSAHPNLEVPRVCGRALARHSALRPAAWWRAMGFTPARSGAIWPGDDVAMSLIQPDGADGPAYLTTLNYRALLDYNCSNFYALSVALLADALTEPAVPSAVPAAAVAPDA